MGETKIEWADHTANWLAGCSKVSPACQHCYAEAMTARLAVMPNAPDRYRDGVVEGRRWTGRVTYDPGALSRTFTGLAAAKSPRRVFVNSMSDTFHSNAPPESLADLADAIRGLDALRGDHTLMLLTKRPGRMLAWQREHFPDGLPSWVWVGCTVEDQQRADERIPILRLVSAAVRYLSCEPLAGPVVIRREWRGIGHRFAPQADDPAVCCCGRSRAHHEHGIGWVIAGGESGPHARPMHPDWARSLRDQCTAAGVPFFFKQWGEWGMPREVISASLPLAIVEPDGRTTYDPPEGAVAWDASRWMVRFGEHAAGRLLDGRTWDQVPDVQEVTRG